MAFSALELSNIPLVLSEPRFTTYLQHSGNDRELALKLYKWNIELSAAFVIPLHILEVAIRNAVVEVLESVHTSNWPWNQGFIISLPDPPRHAYNPRKNLENVARNQPTMGKVVAELKFVFWQKMFTQRHDGRLWNNYIKTQFSNAPSAMSVVDIRKSIHDDIMFLRELRNRIAHHEPIFLRDPMEDYNKILRLLAWRNQIVADWMNGFQTVTHIIGCRP